MKTLEIIATLTGALVWTYLLAIFLIGAFNSLRQKIPYVRIAKTHIQVGNNTLVFADGLASPKKGGEFISLDKFREHKDFEVIPFWKFHILTWNRRTLRK